MRITFSTIYCPIYLMTPCGAVQHCSHSQKLSKVRSHCTDSSGTPSQNSHLCVSNSQPKIYSHASATLDKMRRSRSRFPHSYTFSHRPRTFPSTLFRFTIFDGKLIFRQDELYTSHLLKRIYRYVILFITAFPRLHLN